MFSNNQHVGTRWSPPFTMNGLGSFLESSTIHGLSYIATSNRTLIRLFWVLTVIGGFTGAGVIIYQSFQAWDESPITTTIETRPISEITFPKVTVCPPKNTYTDFNYDLMMTKDITLDNDTRNELINYAVGLLYDKLHKDIMTNLSMLHEENRYYNWYRGYTQLYLPAYKFHQTYIVRTYATSGTISTELFGQQFDAVNVERFIIYSVYIYPPDSVRFNQNVTLSIQIEKISMKNLVHGKETMKLYKYNENDYISTEERYVAKNYTPPGYGSKWTHERSFTLSREIFAEDLKIQKLHIMPGFKITWQYIGIEVEPQSKYKSYEEDHKM